MPVYKNNDDIQRDKPRYLGARGLIDNSEPNTPVRDWENSNSLLSRITWKLKYNLV